MIINYREYGISWLTNEKYLPTVTFFLGGGLNLFPRKEIKKKHVGLGIGIVLVKKKLVKCILKAEI